MTRRDGRDATRPYRVRAGGTWYWIDPTIAAREIEPGDAVLVYPVTGEPQIAVLRGRADADPVSFAGAQDGRFDVPARDIAALHLAAVDTEQT